VSAQLPLDRDRQVLNEMKAIRNVPRLRYTSAGVLAEKPIAMRAAFMM
jgi:hypothetical protein